MEKHYQEAIQMLNEALLSREVELDVLKRKVTAIENFFIEKVS